MKFSPTSCCALGQLSCDNETPIEQIGLMLGRLQRDALKDCSPMIEGGQRAVFCITTPTERQLMRNLIDLRFREVYTFQRRNGYPKGELTMWMLSW